MFPITYLLMYIAYYSGQAVYNTYLNLYLTEIGMSATQIGIMISVSTVGVLLSQLFWGRVSDRSGKKLRVLQALYALAAVFALMFYINRNYLFVFVLQTLFGMMFVPIVPLSDDMTLEKLRSTRWDFGQIRAGGTLGYSLTSLISGLCLKNHYSGIFWWIAGSLFLCFLCIMRLIVVAKERDSYAEEGISRSPKSAVGEMVSRASGEKKSELSVFLRDKVLVVLIVFSLIHSLGNSFFYSYYPIYFVEIGGNSQWVGIMIFACAMSELPFFMNMGRIVKRIGMDKALLAAGILTGLRWLLLSQIHAPYLAVLCNMLQGFSFTAVTWCLLNYINENIPYEFRARIQVLNNVISMIFSKFIFGYLGGALFDSVGTPVVFIGAGCLLVITTPVFMGYISKQLAKKEEK